MKSPEKIFGHPDYTPPQAMTLGMIEDELGSPRDFIAQPSNTALLREWAVLKGMTRAAAAIAKVADLTNYYHAGGIPERVLSVMIPPEPKTDAQALAKAFLDGINAAGLPDFPEAVLRALARDELNGPVIAASLQKIAAQAAQAVYAQLPPKVLQVTGPSGTGTVQGPMHGDTEMIIRIAALGHPVMMVGPAGCGKTTIAEHAAKALNLQFYITNAINDTHELIGFNDGFGKYHPTPFRYAFQNGGVWVADEIDAWESSALLAANSALANGFCSFPDYGSPIMRHPDFRMIATANTFGTGPDRIYVGRNELDGASLDRFATVEITYDKRLEERFAAGRADWLRYVWEVREKVEEKRIRHVVSSRAIIMGAAALNAGLPWKIVKEVYLLKGMSKTDREKIS